MLKRKNRLLEIRRNTKSQNFDSPLFRIKVFSTSNGEKKFGFIVTKKIDKRAVVRNRTKRVLKRAVKNILENINGGVSAVVISKRSLENTDEKNVTEMLSGIFKKTGKIK